MLTDGARLAHLRAELRQAIGIAMEYRAGYLL